MTERENHESKEDILGIPESPQPSPEDTQDGNDGIGGGTMIQKVLSYYMTSGLQ